MIEVIRSRHTAPEEYAEFLRRIGGTNIYGEPNFIVFWGQTLTVKRGRQRWSYGSVSVGTYDVLLGNDEPCWMLAEWQAPTESIVTWDYDLLGPYPHRGFYDIIQKFSRKWMEKGTLHIEPDPLNRQMLRLFVETVKKHKHDSLAKRMSFMQAVKEQREREMQDKICDRLQDATPEWLDSVSYSGQVNKHGVIQQKIEQIERNMKHAEQVRKEHPLSHSVA
jgi:hypothetical protein